MKIKVQREEAQGKYDAEYDQLKWIDNIMNSDDDHPDFDSSAYSSRMFSLI